MGTHGYSGWHFAASHSQANQALHLVDGQYPLSSEIDPEYVASVRDVVRLQLKDLVHELGKEGGLRILPVDHGFNMLPGCTPPFFPGRPGGLIDDLRFLFGMDRRFVKSTDDEQNLTNFHTLADYVKSMGRLGRR